MRRIVIAFLFAALTTGAAHAQTAGGTAEAAASQTTSAAAPTDPRLAIETYYDDVKDIFKETARLLGAAIGPEQRAPLINVQNLCSRSLGQLRAIVRQAQAGGDPAALPRLRVTAETAYGDCRTRFDEYNAG